MDLTTFSILVAGFFGVVVAGGLWAVARSRREESAEPLDLERQRLRDAFGETGRTATWRLVAAPSGATEVRLELQDEQRIVLATVTWGTSRFRFALTTPTANYEVLVQSPRSRFHGSGRGRAPNSVLAFRTDPAPGTNAPPVFEGVPWRDGATHGGRAETEWGVLEWTWEPLGWRRVPQRARLTLNGRPLAKVLRPPTNDGKVLVAVDALAPPGLAPFLALVAVVGVFDLRAAPRPAPAPVLEGPPALDEVRPTQPARSTR